MTAGCSSIARWVDIVVVAAVAAMAGRIADSRGDVVGVGEVSRVMPTILKGQGTAAHMYCPLFLFFSCPDFGGWRS